MIPICFGLRVAKWGKVWGKVWAGGGKVVAKVMVVIENVCPKVKPPSPPPKLLNEANGTSRQPAFIPENMAIGRGYEVFVAVVAVKNDVADDVEIEFGGRRAKCEGKGAFPLRVGTVDVRS